jgi:hypothetical protein
MFIKGGILGKLPRIDGLEKARGGGIWENYFPSCKEVVNNLECEQLLPSNMRNCPEC